MRLWVGAVKSCAGGPCSRMTPSSRKQTRSAMSRAKPISWVAISMVMPARGELADDAQHLCDELGIERARDLVQEHDSRLHGEGTDDRHPLLLATREPVGIVVLLLGEPEALQERPAGLLGLLAGDAERSDGPEGDVAEHGHVREQVEGLEDDADVTPHRVLVDSRRR